MVERSGFTAYRLPSSEIKSTSEDFILSDNGHALLPNSLVIDLLPLVEDLFALGQKTFRLRAKSKRVVLLFSKSGRDR